MSNSSCQLATVITADHDDSWTDQPTMTAPWRSVDFTRLAVLDRHGPVLHTQIPGVGN